LHDTEESLWIVGRTDGYFAGGALFMVMPREDALFGFNADRSSFVTNSCPFEELPAFKPPGSMKSAGIEKKTSLTLTR